MYIGAQENVVSDGLCLQTAEPHRLADVAEEVWPVAADDRRNENEELVDQISAQKRCRERRAAFEQERLHAFLGEPTQLLRDSAGASARTVPMPTATASDAARRS